jgi:23S rRNA pseudouridine955/2504/2580 synthase
MMIDQSDQGMPARTRYRVIDVAGNRTAWVELQPLTGRTHQLRVHMAAIGHPIIGDGKYGGPEAFLTGTISRKMHLHARRLIIDHPDGTPLDITAELPDHFAASMAQLGFDQADGANLAEPIKLPEREAQKLAAKAHSKQYRKERRGERRSGPDGESAARRPSAKKGLAKGPEKGPFGKGAPGKGAPSKGAPRGAVGKPPARGPAKGPSRGPVKGPAKGPPKGPPKGGRRG